MTTTQAPPEVDDPWKFGPYSAHLLRLIHFEPTGEEQAAILRCRKRFKLVVGGGQSGKSYQAAADFHLHIFEDRVKQPEGTLLYWLLAADYERTRREFGYIADNLMAMGLPVRASKRLDPGEIRVQLKREKKPRILVETKSGKDPRTLSMYSPHGIIICEASQLDLMTYHKAIERVTASGGWIHMSGTFESSYGWYPGLAGAWAHGSTDEQSFVLPSPTNKYVYPGGINDPKIQYLKRNSSDAFFNERILGIASPPQGRVFHEFRADIHIRPVVYNPDVPLYIWDDPGYGHAHAIEVAQIAPGGQVQIFDEIYQQGRITEDLIDVVVNRPWWKNPHKTLVIDPNYAQQHQGTHSMAEIWLAKTQLATMGVKVGIMEGIERLKSFLKINPLTGVPGIVFDPGCKGVLSELGAYPSPFSPEEQPRWEVYVWKTDGEGNIMGNDPQDRFNDGLKAVTYGLVEHFGLVDTGENSYFPMKRHGVTQPGIDTGSVLDSLRGIRP